MHILLFLALSIIVVGVTLANPKCPQVKEDAINVHLICHTHDDVGWLKTVDQYYYGARKRITWVGVQYILDSVVEALQKDPERKFIYVESAFFFMWWDQQSEATQTVVKKLVNDGQLEFIGGGWSMNDEAAAHYNAIIDQMSLGLMRLNRTFGSVAHPRIAWQIDPFGHSKEQANIFAQMGMDGLFFGRLDHADKSRRWDNKNMEMIWMGNNDVGKASWIFTGVLPNGYSPPKGFCFDLLCADDPIMDDPKLEESNVEEKVQKFLEAVKNQAEGYATSNLIMTMGEDFDYVGANSWYKNLDKLIRHVNGKKINGTEVNLIYSTPSCYLDELFKAKKKWPAKVDDFFPYSSDPHAYWTGYFTSRPAFKGYVRHANNILQIQKQLSALTGQFWDEKLENLAKSMGIAQHHDAITGTAKQHVSDDYTRRLSAGIAESHATIENAFRVQLEFPISSPDTKFCPLLNISSCPFTENSTKQFSVFIYNPLAHKRDFYVRIPVSNNTAYKVQDVDGNALEVQLVPICESVFKIPGRNSSATHELVFYVESIPPLGFHQFLIQPTKNKIVTRRQRSRIIPVNQSNDTVITKGRLQITFDKDTNLLKSVGLASNETQTKVTQNMFWYAGQSGDNIIAAARASGAYIFRPNSTSSYTIASKAKITRIYDGNLVAEVHQEWGSWVSQIIRLYKHYDFVETEWLVGPIPIDDLVGKEIVSRYTCEEMQTDKTFYTDANGRQMMKRVKDHRATWRLKSTEPISQNYYPVTSRMILDSTNGKGRAALLNDRAQGGTSMENGQMELMVHRRLLFDDAFGVGEPLNETAYGEGLVVRGSHYFIHSTFETSSCKFDCQHRTLAQELLLKPLIRFKEDSPESKWRQATLTKKSSLSSPLPPNVHLLTLEPLQGFVAPESFPDRKWVLRLEHFYQGGDDPILSKPVDVNIKDMFSDWNVTSIEETNLSANKWAKDQERLGWEIQDEHMGELETLISRFERNDLGSFLSHEASGNYTFTPMQIRTFILTVNKKH